MSVTRQYQTYYGVHLNHWDEEWAGNTYNKILVKEYPNEYLSTTSNSMVSDITFMYPTLYKNKYYIDGVAEGHISIYNDDSSASYAVTGYTVELIKTQDVPSAETILGSYTGVISSNNFVMEEDFLTLPVYINLTKQLVNPNERLLLHMTFIGTDYTHLGFSHWNDSSIPDIKLKIPYAPQG